MLVKTLINQQCIYIVTKLIHNKFTVHVVKALNKSSSSNTRYPSSILTFKNPRKSLHPTQKPIDLCKWLIKTYSKENDVVLDFTMGSGSTGVACKELNRNFIGIEINESIYKTAVDRINQ